MFGLLTILIGGLLIVAVSTALDALADGLQPRLAPSSGYSRLEWRANHVLQLQRLTQEDGSGWTMGRWFIPIIKSGVKHGVLKTSDSNGLPFYTKSMSSTFAASTVGESIITDSPTQDSKEDRLKTIVTTTTAGFSSPRDQPTNDRRLHAGRVV
jgi:hypothetical protein